MRIYPGGNSSAFTYDGFGHTVEIVEAGTVSSTKQFVWNNREMLESRNRSGSIVSQYYGYGQSTSGSSYYYSRDQLSSIRELTQAAVLNQYTYTPYGQVNALPGAASSDFQYAGYYYHAASGLNLAARRAYNSGSGRWLNRDPIYERGGVNLYDYVVNSPINRRDPSGLRADLGILFIDPYNYVSGYTPYCTPSPHSSTPTDPKPADPQPKTECKKKDPCEPDFNDPDVYDEKTCNEGCQGCEPEIKRRTCYEKCHNHDCSFVPVGPPPGGNPGGYYRTPGVQD
jgi:RHS repeat-associated protein